MSELRRYETQLQCKVSSNIDGDEGETLGIKAAVEGKRGKLEPRLLLLFFARVLTNE